MPRLYLFLDGLSVVRDDGNYVQIILPRVEGHARRAGSWLMETEISRPELFLMGVNSGTTPTRFDSSQHIIDLGLPVAAARGAASLWAPRPAQILEMLRAQPIPGQRTGSKLATPKSPLPPGANVPDQLATVIVLVYEYTDESGVYLANHPWQPYAVNRSISLHVISTSEFPETKGHEAETEAAMRDLVPGYPGFDFAQAIQPDWRYTRQSAYGDLGAPPALNRLLEPQGDRLLDPNRNFAFLQAQLEHYSQRLQRLGLVGRFYQERRPPDLAWTVPTPIGERTGNCVGYSGD